MKMPGWFKVGRGRTATKAAEAQPWLRTGHEYRELNPDTIDNPWNPAMMQLIASADSAVLADRGIWPQLGSPELDFAWDEMVVDPFGMLRPRDFQAVLLTSLVISGEAWVRRYDGGMFEPMPPPNQFETDVNGRRVAAVWNNSMTVPGGLTLPMGMVDQYAIVRAPRQMRGYSLPDDTQRMMKRSGELALASVNGEIMFRGWGTYFQESTIARSGEEGAELPLGRRMELSLRELGAPNLGPGDKIETLTGATPPTPPLVAQEFVAAHIAGVLGLSRIALTSDAGQANYSASKLSIDNDWRTWGVYRRLIVQATRLLYAVFLATNPERTLDLPDYPEWHHPPPPVTDGAKRAAELKTYYELGIITLGEFRAMLGLPPPPPDLVAPPRLASPAPAESPPPDEETEDGD